LFSLYHRWIRFSIANRLDRLIANNFQFFPPENCHQKKIQERTLLDGSITVRFCLWDAGWKNGGDPEILLILLCWWKFSGNESVQSIFSLEGTGHFQGSHTLTVALVSYVQSCSMVACSQHDSWTSLEGRFGNHEVTPRGGHGRVGRTVLNLGTVWVRLTSCAWNRVTVSSPALSCDSHV